MDDRGVVFHGDIERPRRGKSTVARRRSHRKTAQELVGDIDTQARAAHAHAGCRIGTLCRQRHLIAVRIGYRDRDRPAQLVPSHRLIGYRSHSWRRIRRRDGERFRRRSNAVACRHLHTEASYVFIGGSNLQIRPADAHAGTGCRGQDLGGQSDLIAVGVGSGERHGFRRLPPTHRLIRYGAENRHCID